MEPVDVPVPELNPEGQSQEPEAQAPAPGDGVQPESQAEEFIPYKYRGQEVPLPLQAAEQIAQAIGWKGGAQALVNQLQIAQDAKEFYDAGRRYYQSNAAPQGPPQAPPGYGQPPAPQQYRQPQYQPPVQPQAEDGPDPIAILQQLNQKMSAFDAYVQEQRQQAEYQQQQAMWRAQREAENEHKRFADDLVKRGTPPEKIPDMWRLLQEANEIGLLSAGLPPGEIFNRVYRMNHADDMVQYGVQRQMAQLRDPKAQVTVPATRQPVNPVPPAQTNAEQLLGGMTWSDALQSIPERR